MTIQEFIESYYPNYHNSDNIAELNDMEKYFENHSDSEEFNKYVELLDNIFNIAYNRMDNEPQPIKNKTAKVLVSHYPAESGFSVIRVYSESEFKRADEDLDLISETNPDKTYELRKCILI